MDISTYWFNKARKQIRALSAVQTIIFIALWIMLLAAILCLLLVVGTLFMWIVSWFVSVPSLTLWPMVVIGVVVLLTVRLISK